MAQDITALTSIEALKSWFYSLKRCYFTIYRGYEAKNNNVLYRNEDIEDVDGAWEMMQQVIEAHSEAGGAFQIFVADKKAGNWGMTTRLRLVPTNPDLAAQINGIRPQAPYGGQTQGMWGLYGNPREMLEAEATRRQEAYELKREVEDLRSAQEARIGHLDRFFENLVERPEIYQIIQAFAGKLMSGKPQAPATSTAQDNIGEHAAGDDPQDGYDYDRVDPALDTLRQVFPDTEGVLEALAAWAAANPDMAKNLISNIKPATKS